MAKILHIWSLSKSFPGQVALQDATFDVEEGEVHALVGQNGSGKSTLIKVLAGFHQPDPGHNVTMRDEVFNIGDAAAAHRAGIRFVHQDLGLVEAVSAVENLALGFGYRTGFGRRINWKKETLKTKQALLDLGFDIDVRVPVAALGGAARTGVAIARALQESEQNISILVLDEPTASLPGADVDRLFNAIRRLKTRGIAVVFVSHHLEEVFEIADRVTVLRDAKVVATVEASELDMSSLIELIVGHKVTAATVNRSIDQSLEPRLRVTDLWGPGMNDVSLEVRPGEVLGVAGLTGSGRDTLIPMLSGAMERLGDVAIDGVTIRAGKPSAAIAAGLAFVPADRLRNGIISMMSVRSNTTIANVARNKTGMRLNHKKERAETQDWISQLSVVTTSSEAPISTLSGGNQQKVMMARSFRLDPKVLLLDEPTQGVDVGAKEEIHAFVDAAAANGSAVVIASTDSAELARLCDRVIVMHRGQIVDTIVRGEGSMAQSIDKVLLAGSSLATNILDETSLFIEKSPGLSEIQNPDSLTIPANKRLKDVQAKDPKLMNNLSKNFTQRFQELENHHRSGRFLSGEISEVSERIWKLSQLWMIFLDGDDLAFTQDHDLYRHISDLANSHPRCTIEEEVGHWMTMLAGQMTDFEIALALWCGVDRVGSGLVLNGNFDETLDELIQYRNRVNPAFRGR